MYFVPNLSNKVQVNPEYANKTMFPNVVCTNYFLGQSDRPFLLVETSKTVVGRIIRSVKASIDGFAKSKFRFLLSGC